jgi:hypothetical protein
VVQTNAKKSNSKSSPNITSDILRQTKQQGQRTRYYIDYKNLYDGLHPDYLIAKLVSGCICALMVESLEAIASILLWYLLVLWVSSMYFPVFVVRSHVASQMNIMALSFLTRYDFNAFHMKHDHSLLEKRGRMEVLFESAE